MAVNVVIYGGNPIIDLRNDTVTADKMLTGVTAHAKNGQLISGSIASQAAQTITPGTTDKTIAAGKYLSGAQTIKGDANLQAANIVEGVSIFNVAGTAKKKEAAFVELDNNSTADARMYITKQDAVQSAYHDIGGGGIGSAYALLGSMVVVRCGASCSATATSGCSWVMNVTGTSYRVFAFLITANTATITVKNI